MVGSEISGFSRAVSTAHSWEVKEVGGRQSQRSKSKHSRDRLFQALFSNEPSISNGVEDWSPSGRPQRHAARPVPARLKEADQLDGPKDPATWTLVGLFSASDLGHVRTGMTYDKDYGTSASFGEKPRRMQYFESANEPAVADYLEMSPRVLDYQFQALGVAFRRADGKLIYKYPDVAIEFDDHSVRFGEIKSNSAWFNASGIRRPLDRIDIALASKGFEPLLRISGQVFRRDRVIEALHKAMDARLTVFDDIADVHAVRNAIVTAGGCASYGTLIAALGGRRSHAESKLYAMLLRRIISFTLENLPTADTPVAMPKAARAFALREVLNRFQQKAA